MAATRSKRKKEQGNELFVFLLFVVALAVPTAAIMLRASTAHRVLLPLSLLAFLFGAMLEYRRIAQSWRTVRWTVLKAYAASFLAFLPGKNERTYNVEDHIALWPYLFCGLFALFAAIAHRKQIMSQLHEGITLLQSLAFVYWLVDVHGMLVPGVFMGIIFTLVGLITMYVLINAMLPLSLSRTKRLWLSIWSSCVLLILAIDNIVRVAKLGYIEDGGENAHILMIVLNYVLLGVSSIYMMQNAMMLFEFFPEKGEGGPAYRKRIGQLKKDHTARYSKEQLPLGSAVTCILFCVIAYGLNFVHEWVPRSFAIWAVLLVFPPVHFVVASFFAPRLQPEHM